MTLADLVFDSAPAASTLPTVQEMTVDHCCNLWPTSTIRFRITVTLHIFHQVTSVRHNQWDSECAVNLPSHNNKASSWLQGSGQYSHRDCVLQTGDTDNRSGIKDLQYNFTEPANNKIQISHPCVYTYSTRQVNAWRQRMNLKSSFIVLITDTQFSIFQLHNKSVKLTKTFCIAILQNCNLKYKSYPFF